MRSSHKLMDTDHAPPAAAVPASKHYIHLILPIATATLICTNRDIASHLLNPKNATPLNSMLLVAASSIPTHLIASNLNVTNRPYPTPEESVRFTRKHESFRALVLATYGRLYGTPFNLQFFIADFLLSYVIGYAIGERPVGARQRRSEFLIAVLWLAMSWVLMATVPPSMETLKFWVTVGDRTIWRATYLALVDDVIGLLTFPDVKTIKGRVTLVLTQAFTITSLVWFGLSWIKRYQEGYFQST